MSFLRRPKKRFDFSQCVFFAARTAQFYTHTHTHTHIYIYIYILRLQNEKN